MLGVVGFRLLLDLYDFGFHASLPCSKSVHSPAPTCPRRQSLIVTLLHVWSCFSLSLSQSTFSPFRRLGFCWVLALPRQLSTRRARQTQTREKTKHQVCLNGVDYEYQERLDGARETIKGEFVSIWLALQPSTDFAAGYYSP